MSEIARQNIEKDDTYKGRESVYPDGTVNIVFDKPGMKFNFAEMGENNESLIEKLLTSPVSLKIDHSHRDSPSREYVVLMPDLNMLMVQKDLETGKVSRHFVDDYETTSRVVDLLQSEPIMIGTRPDQLKGGKLMEVAYLRDHMMMPFEEVTPENRDKTNVLSFALEYELGTQDR